MAKPPTPNRFRVQITGLGNEHGKHAEARMARTLGLRLQPNSGAMAGAKGDMRSANWLVEAKTTVNSTIPIDLGWLVKITGEALALGLRPAVALSFVLPSGRPRPNSETDWVLVPACVFRDLTDSQ